VEAVPNLAVDFPSLFEAAQEYGNQAQGGGLAGKVAMASGHNVQSGGASWSNKGGAAPNLEEEFPGLPGSKPSSNAPPPKPYGVKPQQKQQVKQRTPTEDFPGLPASSRQSAGSNRSKSSKASDFPSLGPSKSLGNFSASARASSAPKTGPAPATARHAPQRNNREEEEDFSWSSDRDFVSSSDPTTQGNLKFIKSINSNCDNSDSSKSMSVKSAPNLIKSDFPGLGKPEKKLNDFIATSSVKNKNKTKNNNNSVSRKTVHAAPDLSEKTSLSSIAGFLDPEEKKKKEKKSPTPQPQPQLKEPTPQPPPKPTKQEPAPEPLYRPSKEKKSEKPAAPSQKSKTLDSEDFPSLGGPASSKSSNGIMKKLDQNDFPSLGGPAKKITANFVKVEKKTKPAAPKSQFSEDKHSKSSSASPRPASAPKTGPPPPKSAPFAPQTAKARHAPLKDPFDCEDFSWSSERDFVSSSDPTTQGNLKLIKSINGDISGSGSGGGSKKNVKLGKDDFPTLGGPAKKINANFVKAENKLVKVTAANSQWNEDKLASSFKENNTPIENRQQKSQPTAPANQAPGNNHSDFPGLEPANKSNAPPGFSKKAPPGFSNPSATKAPPGFSQKVLVEKKTYLYHHPDSFQDRNAALINTISTLLGGKSLEFKKFRELSVSFRAGSLAPSEYYQECSKLVSKKAFSEFFPELVALLPDIKKQQTLLSLHNAAHPNSGLASCEVCDQVLLGQDHTLHENSHALDSDFPALGF